MFIKVLTLFSWIICFYLYESSITIPFHKRIDTLTLQTNPLKEKTHNYLECEIGIGTPKQTIKVLLEFYSNGIWIIQPDCGDVVMTSNLQNKQTPFYEHLSSTFKNQSRYFNKYREYRRFTRYSKAKQGYDTFSFGNENVEVNNLMFFSAQRFSNLPIASGVLGLELNNVHFSTIAFGGWINKLAEANSTIQELFCIDYLSNDYGKFIIGQNDDLKQIQKNTGYSFKHIDQYYWEIIFDIISYGDDAYMVNVPVSFQIELGVIIAPDNYYKFIKKTLFDKYFQKCREVNVIGTDYKTFTCDQNIHKQIKAEFNDIIFELNNNFTTSLTSEDLFFINKDDNSIIFTVYFYVDGRRLLNNEWVVGEPFFRKNLVVFDINNKTIGLYAKQDFSYFSFIRVFKQSFQSIYSIHICCIGLLIFLILIIFIMKKINHKKNIKMKIVSKRKGLIPTEQNENFFNDELLNEIEGK